MDNLQIVVSLDDATKILVTARNQLASGSLCLWRMVAHAEGHLNKQIEAILAPDPELTGRSEER